jgi:hypothetical protein
MNSTFSHLTGARQTMMAWARPIDSIEQVPEIYMNTYWTLAGNRSTLPYMVLVPTQGGPRRSKSSEKLLYEVNETFYTLERTGSQIVSTGFRYPDICSLEVGNILLYSWFSIHGKTTGGAAAGLQVEFNEANLRYFEPFFARMRPAPASLDEPGLRAELAKFDGLSDENYKLMNFARQSLLPGERVVQFLYQPLKRKRLLSVLGGSLYRSLTLAHLTILTDQEVILLGDAERITEKERSRYGGVRCYLPLQKIVSLDLGRPTDDLLSLTFQVSPGFPVTRLFDVSRLSEIESLKRAIESSSGNQQVNLPD